MPLALSVHNFISSVGADVGFASIIGLAILVLLYFSQARDTAALREEADDLALRLQQAEARLAQMSRQPAPAAVPVAAPASAAAPPPGSTIKASRATAPVAVAPAAPAGVAAPALAAATRVVPVAALPDGSGDGASSQPAAEPAVFRHRQTG